MTVRHHDGKSPPDAPPPRRGTGANGLSVRQELLPLDSTAPFAIPGCTVCGSATLRTGPGGRPMHSVCEPSDVGLTDPATSRAAAERAHTGPGSPLAQSILEQLRRADDGLTDDELSTLLPSHPVGSVAKRRLDLTRAGLAEDTGRTRPTRWNRDAIVWAASRTDQ